MLDKEKIILQKKIVDKIPPKESGRLILAPRLGKTKIMIDIIKRDKPKSILWVTPSAELAEKDIPNEFIKWKAKSYLKNLTTVTWVSLNTIIGNFELIVLDEEQFITDNNISSLLTGLLVGKRILSMTGTPTKHKDKIKLYNTIGLNILYDISINDAVNMNILSNYKVYVIEVELDTTKNIEAGSKNNKFLTSEKANYQYLDRIAEMAIIQCRKDATFRILNRMRAIKNSKSKTNATKLLLSKLQGRILLFAGSINQAEELCEHRFHSKTDDKDYLKFQNGEIDRIAMVNTGGTGHTYKNIDDLILVQADSDKNGLTSQKICRTLLKQKDYNATVWIICLSGTQDEKWVKSALKSFDTNKVEYIKFDNIKDENYKSELFNKKLKS